MLDLAKIGLDAKFIAQDIAPKDTGNLALNSIQLREIPNGLQLVYIGSIAPYWTYQQFGTKYSTKNQGFIFPRTELAIGSYLSNVVGGDRNNANASRERVSEFMQNTNPARNDLLINNLANTMKVS